MYLSTVHTVFTVYTAYTAYTVYTIHTAFIASIAQTTYNAESCLNSFGAKRLLCLNIILQHCRWCIEQKMEVGEWSGHPLDCYDY